MFILFRKIIELLKSVDSDVLVAILNVVQKILTVGLPPNVKSEKEFRAWIGKVVLALDDLAKISSSDFDDKIVDLLGKAFASDDIWSLFYGLLISLIDDDNDLSFTAGDVESLSNKVEIDPTTIYLIIKLIIEVLSWFRK